MIWFKKAESISDLPPVKALVSFVRGSISQKEKKLTDALQQFQQANQFAGQSRNGPLALDAGMKMAECLLQSNEPAKATDILRQTAQMAQQLRAPVQERACADMLAKANASMQTLAALQAATRVLQLTQQLGFVKFEPTHLYNVGLFNFMLKRHGENCFLIASSKVKLPGNPQPTFEKEVLFTLAMAQLRKSVKHLLHKAIFVVRFQRQSKARTGTKLSLDINNLHRLLLVQEI